MNANRSLLSIILLFISATSLCANVHYVPLPIYGGNNRLIQQIHRFHVTAPDGLPVQFRLTRKLFRYSLPATNAWDWPTNWTSTYSLPENGSYSKIFSTSFNVAINPALGNYSIGDKVPVNAVQLADYVLEKKVGSQWLPNDWAVVNFNVTCDALFLSRTAWNQLPNKWPIEMPEQHYHLYIGGRFGERPTDSDLSPSVAQSEPSDPCDDFRPTASLNSVHIRIPIPYDSLGRVNESLQFNLESIMGPFIDSSSIGVPISATVQAVTSGTGSSTRLLQIITPNYFYVVNDPSATDQTFTLELYPRAVGAMPDAAGLLTPSGSPLSTITIENPDRTLATTGQLRMTSTVDGHSEVVDYYHRPQDNEWEMVKDGGFYHEIIKTESNNLQDPVGGNPLPRMVRLRKTFNFVNNAIHTISETRETYERLACGTRLISRVEDPDGVARETTWTWGVTGTTTTDPTFGRNIKINRPDGSWTRYGYDQYGRGVKQASGIGNQPDNTPDADCRVVEHVINPVGAPSWTRLEVERRAGIEVSRRYIREYNDGYDQIVCLTQGAAWDAADNLVTKVRYHTTGLFAGLIKSRQSPEGLLSLTSYTASPSSVTTQVALNEFTTVTHTGVPNSGGTAILEGTTVTTVTNRQGRVIQEAEHDFVTGHLLRQTLATQVDSRGRALERLHLDGRTDSVVYDCCGIASETDRNNVTRTYTDVESEGLTSQVTQGITETKAKLGGLQIWTRLGTDDSLFEINRSQRNLAGEVTSSYTLADGQSSQVLTHPMGGGTELTTTFSDEGTKVISLWADGSVKSVTGTAVAPRRFERGVETNGLVWVKEIALDELGVDTSEWAMLWTDLAGRTVKTQKSGSEAATRNYNVIGQLVKEIDPDGVIVLHEKDTLGRLSTVCLDMNRNGIIDFNGSDMVLQTTRAFATRGGARVVERATEKAWAEFNDPTASTMRVVERAVDGLDSWVETGGLITHTQKQHLAGNGNWTVTTTYPDDSKTVVTYANGRLFKVEDKDSADVVLDSVTHVYDAHGRLHSKTDGKGAQSVFAYRTADNPEVGGPLVTSDQLASVQSPPVGSSETTPVSLFGYDVRGRRNLLTDPLNGTVQTNFYHTGLVSQVSGTRAYPVSYTYTAQGRLSSMTTATGVTQWDYHAESGWPWRKWIDSALASTLTYTDAGRLLTKTNGRGTVITHGRDNGGRVTSVDYADTTTDVAFTYDRLGRVLTAALAGGGTATMNRHLLGQMEAEAWTGGSLGGLTVNHGYDTLRRRQTLAVSLDSAPVSQQTFGYDAGSRFESVVFEGHTATYERDENASHITGLNYGVSGSPGLANIVSRDVAGRIESLAYTVGAAVLRSHEYEMDDMGRRLREEAESGDGKSWLYNDRGEISQASHEFADETAKHLEQFSYLYDGIGNRTSATVAGRVQAYTPDDQNRYLNRTVPPYYHLRGEADEDAGILVNQQTVSRHGRAFWKELSFDNASSALFGGIRIVAAKPGAGPGGADLVAVENRTAYLAPATESFLYDADGNLTEDARRTYEWDAENRLIRVTDKAGAVEPPDPPFAAPSRKRVSHEYDTASRRIRKLVEEWDAGSSSWQAEGDVRYVYDGWNVIAELEATGSGLEMRRGHAWGLDVTGTPQGAGGVGGLLFTAHHESGSGTTVHTVCYDGNGNVTALANAATGTLSAYYDYDAFGTTLRATGAAAASNGYRFSTKPVDEETGLVYYGYRWYHPELGRWLSRDPIGEAGGLNLYGMAGNDPVNGVDVLGLEVAGYHSWRRHADALTDGSPSRDGQTPNVSVKDKCGRDWVYVAEHDFWIRLGLSSALQDKCCGPDDLIKGPRYGLDGAGDEGVPNQDDRSSTRQRADELQRLAEELSGRNPLVEAREQIPEVLAKTGSEMLELGEAFGNMTLAGSLLTTRVGVGLAANRLGTLTRAGDNVWDSAGGLRYAGTDRAGLNRVQHVLRHAEADPSRATHSVFNVGRNKVLGLVDEAWGMRGNPLANDPGAYVVPMGRAVGTTGENAVKIIVRPGTNEIITSYPVFVP